MACLGCGKTTLASLQKLASVGRASGSFSMAFLISRSLNERSCFQFVGVFADALGDALPVGFPFMLFCPPCRNNPAFGLGHLGVDHRDFKIVYDPDGVDSNLAVVKAVIHLLKRGAFENPERIFERYSMARKVAAVLPWIPRVAHRFIFTLCIYGKASARARQTPRHQTGGQYWKPADLLARSLHLEL